MGERRLRACDHETSADPVIGRKAAKSYELRDAACRTGPAGLPPGDLTPRPATDPIKWSETEADLW